MLSQKTIFSLKGTNIHLPNRYKIRKFKQIKLASQKLEKDQSQSDAQHNSPLIIESRDSHLQTQKPNTVQVAKSIPKIYIKPELAIEKQLTYKRNETRMREHYSSTRSKRCACGDCPECLKDFAYFLHIFSDDQSEPQISAKSWCIWKKKNGKFVYYYGKRIHKVREIASLSKMITAMTAIDFLSRNNLDPQKIKYEVRKSSVMIGGTTAGLNVGEVYNLLDLLYGMMLPSGNDAAIAISEVIGLISFLKGKGKQIDPHHETWYENYRNKNYSYIFIGMMNEKCQKIGTLDTHMFNSHGNDAYDQLKNISTCNQVAKISSQFMGYPLLREIVKSTEYGKFENTNKLLEDGFEGIKTGITDTAGPCLAASYKDLIIVVLHSKSMNQRWIEVKKLVKWIIKKS